MSHRTKYITKAEKASRNETLLYRSIQNDSQDLDWVEFRQKPTPTRLVIAYGREFFEWAQTQTTFIKAGQFFRPKGISRATIARWRKRSIEFNNYYEMGLEEIGDRRESLAFAKNASESICLSTMAIYDPDYKAHLAWKAELARKESAQQAADAADAIAQAVKQVMGPLTSEENK